MRNFRLLAVLLILFVFTASEAQVGSYFSKFRPSKKWSVGLQLAGTTLSGDADDMKLGLAYGLHAKYSLGQSFGLKLAGNMGTLQGGRMEPNFSGTQGKGVFGADRVDQQNPEDGLYNGGSQASNPDSYEFTNNYRDLNLTAVYTLGNLSFLRPLRSIQMFTFFGAGFIWSDVEGHFAESQDAKDYYTTWGPSYFIPYGANDMELDVNADPFTIEEEIVDAKSFYRGRDLAIPFGVGFKYNINKLMDVGVEWKTHWTRNDFLDGFSFPVWKNRQSDYYHNLGVQLSFKLGAKDQDAHYDWLNPMETIYADMDSMKDNIEKLKPLLDDQDGDGVSDYYDQEADTDCDKVYGNGVAVDTDGDGIADCKDAEINSPCKEVDENGVSIDTDNDGVPDCIDQEANTAEGGLVDVNGVAIEINEACCDCENVVLPCYRLRERKLQAVTSFLRNALHHR